MNQHLRDTVWTIAQGVRSWATIRAEKANYNPKDLCGWCAISAARMFEELKQVKISAEIHMHNNFPCHVFLVVDDHVVDVTATQFKETATIPILIMHTKEAERYDFYKSTEQFSSTLELQKYQKKNRWPKHQIAFVNTVF